MIRQMNCSAKRNYLRCEPTAPVTHWVLVRHDFSMSIIIEDRRPDARQRQLAELRERNQVPSSYVTTDTPLYRELSDIRRNWLTQYVCDRWIKLHGDLSAWRAKMTKWEEYSESDYSSRRGEPNPNDIESVRDIFSYQNESLGVVEGFVDFAAAQAKNDIFGTRPWLAASPEGKDDIQLAEVLTKHASWKINQSNSEEVLRDAIRIACWGGTAFVKARWENDVDTSKALKVVAHSVSTGKPIMTPDGDYISDLESLPPDLQEDGRDVAWRDLLVEEVTPIYQNVLLEGVDYKSIAFETTAKRLDLAETDVFVRFKMGLLDVVSRYGLNEEQKRDLRSAVMLSNDDARARRGESDPSKTPDYEEDDANPLVQLVEGYVRCDPMQTGRPARIHVIFSPDLLALFRVDYLKNVSPGAILPVFPIRIFKLPNRVLGMGFFEKYDGQNRAVDRHHNVVTQKQKLAAHTFTGVQPDALKNRGAVDLLADPTKLVELAPDKTMGDVLSFASVPEQGDRNIELLNQMLQMMQMRSGITSAAQGELKGVPNATTATGVNQLQSRGALLLKDPIDTLTMDVRNVVEYEVHLIYANQDRDETFTWGEGEDTKLLSIKAGDVQGLRANVTLTLVQAQNQAKLTSAQAAIAIAKEYAGLPEAEKPSQRRLYVQAIASLGFNDAEEIIRKSTVDPAGILAVMPPEVRPVVEAALVSAGLITPSSSPPTAPVTE